MERLVECVPNFSEGKRLDIIKRIVSAIEAVPGAVVLDQSQDPDHHRCVITFVGEPEAVADAAFQATRTAVELIDLNHHHGAHPRLGATDVIPFVPLRSITMEECVKLARQLGQRIAEELQIPIYLYECAATQPDRVNLADIRRGEFELLRDTIGTDPNRVPDFGEPKVHPTAGATAVGARALLIAYNVNLETDDLKIAKHIAKSIRGRDGGLQSVKALGFALKERGIVQVSMNLVNYQETSIVRAFEFVKQEAASYGVEVKSSEIVGLIPQAALDTRDAQYLQLEGFSDHQVLEIRLLEALQHLRPGNASGKTTEQIKLSE